MSKHTTFDKNNSQDSEILLQNAVQQKTQYEKGKIVGNNNSNNNVFGINENTIGSSNHLLRSNQPHNYSN